MLIIPVAIPCKILIENEIKIKNVKFVIYLNNPYEITEKEYINEDI